MSVPGVTKSAKTWSHLSINHLFHLYTVAREIVIYNKTSLIQAPKMTVSHVDVLFSKLSVSQSWQFYEACSIVILVWLYKAIFYKQQTRSFFLSFDPGYVLEILALLCSLPTYLVLFRALWQDGEISLVEQQLVMFTAPSNVVQLIYCSSLSARILGFVGIATVYWLFNDVKITKK